MDLKRNGVDSWVSMLLVVLESFLSLFFFIYYVYKGMETAERGTEPDDEGS